DRSSLIGDRSKSLAASGPRLHRHWLDAARWPDGDLRRHAGSAPRRTTPAGVDLRDPTLELPPCQTMRPRRLVAGASSSRPPGGVRPLATSSPSPNRPPAHTNLGLESARPAFPATRRPETPRTRQPDLAAGTR